MTHCPLRANTIFCRITYIKLMLFIHYHILSGTETMVVVMILAS